MDVNERIKGLMAARGWTEYRLAKESGLSQSTITNLFKRNTVPGITTLEAICKSFGITLAQFFADGSLVELSEEQTTFFQRWAALSPEQKLLLEQLVDNLK